MTLLRDTIKSNFVANATPTEAQFAELIDSGFDLHQFTYRADYPYEAGNIVFGTHNGTIALYKREDYDIGAINKAVSDTSYWTLVYSSIFNIPNPGQIEPPIKAPFVILNEDKSLIGYNTAATDTTTPYIQGKTLIFEERSYNMPGKNMFKWEVIDRNSEVVSITRYSRDLQYSFNTIGQYKVRLSVWEFGIDEPEITDYDLSIGEVLQASMSMSIIASPISYSNIGTTIFFTITYTNTGNLPITNIVTSAIVSGTSLPVALLSSLPVGDSGSITCSYITLSTDAGLNYITLNATGNGLSESNTISASNSCTVTNENVLGGISIVQDFTYKTAYINTPFTLPITAVFTPNISSRISQIEYIKSAWFVSGNTKDYAVTHDTAVYTAAIPNGVDFSYDFLINNLTSENTNQVTLKYKDPYTSEAISNQISFYAQSAVNIDSVSIIRDGELFRVTVIINKYLPMFVGNTNAYIISEAVDDGEFTPIAGEDITDGGTTKRTFSFYTDLIEGDEDVTYKVKVLEDLGNKAPQIDGSNMTSEDTMEYNYTTIPKAFWGEVVNVDLRNINYGDAWNDYFMAVRTDSEYPWVELTITNPAQVFVNWKDRHTNKNTVYGFIALPTSVYPNAFNQLYDSIGGLITLSDEFFIFLETIDEVEYRIYTQVGGIMANPIADAHQLPKMPMSFTFKTV